MIDRTVWLISPTGRQIVEMPFKPAMRIAQKRDWDISTVEPRLTLWEKVTKHPHFKRGASFAIESIINLVPLVTFVAIIASMLLGKKSTEE